VDPKLTAGKAGDEVEERRLASVELIAHSANGPGSDSLAELAKPNRAMSCQEALVLADGVDPKVRVAVPDHQVSDLSRLRHPRIIADLPAGQFRTVEGGGHP
jgi:hypothetical protein